MARDMFTLKEERCGVKKNMCKIAYVREEAKFYHIILFPVTVVEQEKLGEQRKKIEKQLHGRRQRVNNIVMVNNKRQEKKWENTTNEKNMRQKKNNNKNNLTRVEHTRDTQNTAHDGWYIYIYRLAHPHTHTHARTQTLPTERA